MFTTNQFTHPARQVFLPCIALLVLTACSAGKDKISLDPEKNLTDVWRAATTPLEDFNIRREEIPSLLKTAAKNPYSPPDKLQCAVLKTEVTALDTLLGADIQINEAKAEIEEADDESMIPPMPKLSDIPEVPSSGTLVNKGAGAVHDRAIDFIREQTDILPFRSIIRKISGADRHARKVQEAKKAGELRRAYLKGLAQAKFGKVCMATAISTHAEADQAKKEDDDDE